MYLYLKKTFHFVGMIVLCLFLIRTFLIEPGMINGRSMENTYLDNDFFFTNKIAYFFRTPKHGDVVSVKSKEEGKIIIKRIIGLPGEKIKILNGRVFLISADGTEIVLDEPYLKKPSSTYASENKPFITRPIPRHSYFLMGDNRPMSGDSRTFGFFHRSEIYGPVITVPFFNK